MSQVRPVNNGQSNLFFLFYFKKIEIFDANLNSLYLNGF